MYDKIQPVYGIAIVGTNYFKDDRPVHSFIIADSETGQALQMPFGKKEQARKPFEMVIVELKKLQLGEMDVKQQLWMEFPKKSLDFSEKWSFGPFFVILDIVYSWKVGHKLCN
ncbi:TPA: hypothetical protein ACGO4G_000341 [Streptococcus suis]